MRIGLTLHLKQISNKMDERNENKNKDNEITNNQFSANGYICIVFSKNVKLPVKVRNAPTNNTR
tara:strand:+ start:1448 stop:1639 length:192 start_codon:yes stop_codon:yes gene_type:complete